MIGAVVLAAVLGLVIGSFLTVVTSRVPVGLSIVRPASRCPACSTPIRTVDNVPVVSYVLRRGRCHACGAAIAFRYPATEIVTAVLFALVTVRVPTLWLAPAYCALAAGLVALSVIDLEHRRLPTRVIAVTALVGAVLLVAGAVAHHDAGALARVPIGAVIGFGLFGLIFVVAPGGMGFGDVRLATLCGGFLAFLGYRALAVGGLAAFLSAGFLAVVLVAIGRAGRKTALPFGPFIAAGTLLAVLAGGPIARLWLG